MLLSSQRLDMALKMSIEEQGQEKAQEKFPISKDVPLPAKGIRHRSPSYPTVGLQEALERTKKFYGIDGKAGAPIATAVKHIGFASAHGQALSVLSALKKYGLLEDKSGRVVPTQRAIELLNLPDQDPRRVEALRQAALAPAIYRELIQQYRETGLPSDETLKAELVTYKNFNPNSVDDFIRFFKSTLEFAGLSDLSVIESDPEMQSQPKESADQSGVRAKNPQEVRIVNPGGGRIPVNPPTISAANMWTWTLSIPRSVKAELRIAGDVTKADIVRLKKQIEFLESSFDEESEEQR
jgi:hypothetical protein